MERELTIERTRAGLDVARQLGRKGARKRQMTESRIKSAKKLLASGVPPRDVARNLGLSALHSTAGFRPRIKPDCIPYGLLTSLRILLAAHARSLGLTLVMNNTREFGRVQDLQIENWTEPIS
jgi:hypothetical protein